MWFIIVAVILYNMTLLYRGFYLSSEVKLKSPQFWLPLSICLIANIIAYRGFWLLANPLSIEAADYGVLLSVLSLLSAGVISGNFSFTHQDSADDEGPLVSLIACIFVSLFYLIFSSVCFYSGRSIGVYNAPGATHLIPAVVFLILMANTFYEYWDYRVEK